MFPAFLTVGLFSLSAIFATRASRLMGGTEANFWRLSLATLLLAIVSETRGVGLGGPAFPLFFLSGLIGFGGGDLALFQALPRLGSRLTMMLVHCLAAPLASLIEYFWLGTTLTGREVICGAVILGGVSLALAPGEHLNLTPGRRVVGTCFGIAAALGQALGAVISRKAYALADAAGQGTHGIQFGIDAAFQRIVGGTILVGLFLLFVKRDYIKQAMKPWAAEAPLSPLSSVETGTVAIGSGHGLRDRWAPVWPWLILNALAGPTLGVSCFQWALSLLPTGVLLPIVALTPLTVIPLAAVIEGEKLAVRSVAGGVVAVLGVVALKVDESTLRYFFGPRG